MLARQMLSLDVSEPLTDGRVAAMTEEFDREMFKRAFGTLHQIPASHTAMGKRC